MSARPLLLLTLAACSLVGETGEPARPSQGPVVAPVAPPPEPGVGGLTAIAPPLAIGSTAAAIDAWPRFFPGVHARAVTSYDRGDGNDDGFGGTYSALYVDARGEHVVFDETGPGVLRTLWFTSAESGDAPLALGKIRFYVDDDVEPRIAVDANELFAGNTAPFVSPLVAANFASSGGFASWAPIPYRKRLRVTTEKRAGFYQAHYDELPADWDVTSYVDGSDAALATRFASGVATHPLEEVALDATKPGSGVIQVLRFVPNAVPSDAVLRNPRSARIRIWFDGATEPQVDAPLGFFFGSGLGLAPVQSIAWTMQSRLFESRMPMPFWDGVRIAITGIAGKLYLHVGGQDFRREEAGTFEARYHEERPTAPDRDFVYADVTGTGKLVATVLAVDPVTANVKQWWEGDLRTRVDGARTPVIHGTGHEDDHLGGWSNEFLSRPFTLPMHGCPRTVLYDTGGEFQVNGATTMYRLWPGIGFSNALRHSTEHGWQNGRSLPYAATTFLYRQARARKVMTDGFDVADASRASAHAYFAPNRIESTLTSAFEGESAAPLSARLHEFTEPTTFALAIDPNNEGVELRRLFDHAEAPIRNAVEVDGVRVTDVATWGPVAESRSWSERDVFIPAQLTKGKTTLRVRWVPGTLAGERRSNAARFEAWSILP